MKPERFRLMRRRRVRLLAVPVFTGGLGVAYWAVPRMAGAWFTTTVPWNWAHPPGPGP